MNGKETRQSFLQILLDALELPEEQREAFVSEKCQGDKALERRVWAALNNEIDDPSDSDAEVEDDSSGRDTETTFELPYWVDNPLLDSSLQSKIPEKYKLLQLLNRGGQGAVYRAFHQRLEIDVAVKIFTSDSADAAGDVAKRRFIKEAQMLSQLDHPNICRIFDADETEEGLLYIVMEFLEGHSLKSLIELRVPETDEVLDYFEQIVDGLVEAHKQDLVHQDMKPSNIMSSADGTIKLIDFGAARNIFNSPPDTIGTLRYMSPEQIRGEEDVDYRTDVWSLGITILELLSGKHPFAGVRSQVAKFIQSDQPVGIPANAGYLRPVLEKSLHKNKAFRYRSAIELHADLKKIGDRQRKREMMWVTFKSSIAWVLLILVSLTGLILFMMGGGWTGPGSGLAAIMDWFNPGDLNK